MKKSKKPYIFPIEKLAAIERNLKLLNTSVTITHTPIRTFKSIVKANMVLPTKDIVETLIDSSQHLDTHPLGNECIIFTELVVKRLT